MSTNPSSPLITASGLELSAGVIVATIRHAVNTDENALRSSDFFMRQGWLSGGYSDAIHGQNEISIPYQTSKLQNAITNTRKINGLLYTLILNTTLMLNYLQSLDIQLLEMMRNLAIVQIDWFRPIIFLFSDSEPIVFWLFLIGLWLYGIYLKNDKPKQVALELFWCVMIVFVMYWIINQLLPMRPRPESVINIAPLIDHLPDNSFPSGHALFWGASWWALKRLLNRPWVTMFFFMLGWVTCFMRVIAGIHYPGDIIVGFFLWWGISELLLRLPHGEKYQKYTQTIPLKIARYIGL